MDTKMKLKKSLPPLVEGRIHGYLKLVIDEVIWSARNFNEISVFVTWWGETIKSQFRPTDITKNIVGSQQDTTEIYAIRTNINLFEEYIKNCGSVELVIVSDENNLVLGTSQITDLLDIFNYKPHFRYVPIITNSGNKIGEIHVSIKLEHAIKSLNTQSKLGKYETKQGVNNGLLSTIGAFKNQGDMINEVYCGHGNLKHEESDIYKSILKSKRTEFQEPINKCNDKVTDKLVAQVVARAQRLRGALLKETCTENMLSSNYNLINNSMHSDSSIENELKLHECCFDKGTTSFNENKAFSTLRSTFLNSNKTDFACNSLTDYKSGNKETSSNTIVPRMDSVLDNVLVKKKLHTDSEETNLLMLVNYIRINIESLTLSPAGYRRVKSSSLSDTDNTLLSASFFVQYDMTFDYISKTGKKWIKEGKPIRICSKRQTNDAIYFNHSTTYRISKLDLHTEHFIKFKILIRHLNRKLLTELGSSNICVNDVTKSDYWKIAKNLNIFSKGIKIGELGVIIELGSDSSQFEKQCVDTVFAKENIPILETHLLKSKPVAETQSKSSNEISPLSTGAINYLTTSSDIASKTVFRNKTRNVDDKRVDIRDQENKIEDKVLLHGLIYIAEGQELLEPNTYLICRAFWREDKTKSQICNNTKNPFYQFCQLVPLIYDNNLLERIKNNYIIIEVYSRKNNTDNLLGLTKLPVHHLYVAFNDPNALPNLLLSKYPVMSVDGWVPIIDPVTGQFCGQLLALVALGTSEQIACLEISRGLRNIGIATQTTHLENLNDYMKRATNVSQLHVAHDFQSNMETCSQNNSQVYTTDTLERASHSSGLKNRECQTDISTVSEIKFPKRSQEEVTSLEHPRLHDIVDHSTESLSVIKTNIDRSAQTEISMGGKKQTDMEEQMCINELNFNNFDDSDNHSVPHNFHLSTDTYRSVGVGAEYNEELNQQQNTTHSTATFEFPTISHTENESINSACSKTTFRAVVEIECALHLPRVEKVNEAVEPSTYVSFQAAKSDHSKRQNTHMITDIFPHSCNPKWNWKCDTKLPTELLLHDEKRLILKIWRILDTDISMQRNLERDVVIGFSAIDLSILVNGFPTVSGWFHIMDFTGKCNGQIKICITPLDNLSFFGKSVTTLNSGRVPTCSVSQSSWFPLHASEIHPSGIEKSTSNYNLSSVVQGEEKLVQNENQSTDSIMHVGFEDVSMSFLSLSLKTKLTELDEITQRLQSRLRDVTNAAFEDDMENEFDLNEPNSDNEINDYKNAGSVISIATTNQKKQICRIAQENKNLLYNNEENQITAIENSVLQFSPQTSATGHKTVDYEIVSSNPPKVSNVCSRWNLSNDSCQQQQQTAHFVQHSTTLDNTLTDSPERGTKTHINYLLDKLSLQFPVRSHLIKDMPMNKRVPTLFTNFKQKNNDVCHTNDCEQTYTLPASMDAIREPCNTNSERSVVNDVNNEDTFTCESKSLPEATMQLQTGKKISNLIREELIAEENNDTARYDELTTYLVTSNIRHMDLNDIFNPLLYSHLAPDLHHLKTSPEDESIEELDNQYSKVFSTSVTNRLSKIHTIVDADSPVENVEHIRQTFSGLPENFDDSITLTHLRKTSYNDVLASNNTESTTTLSSEGSFAKTIDSEVVENDDPTSSETSVLVLSRQAPDGGNPTEDNKKPLAVQLKNQIQDSSSSTCN